MFAQLWFGFVVTINNRRSFKDQHKGDGPASPGSCHPVGRCSSEGCSVQLTLHLVQDPDDNVP